MYCASSSFAAWTLKLPSVAPSKCLRSLKLSDSLTASALTMPSRMRSWIRRSMSGAVLPVARSASPRTTCVCARGVRSRSCGAACPLATIPPGDDDAERNVQAAEPGRQAPGAPRRRAEQRDYTHQHEAEPQDGHDAHRVRPRAYHPGAVQQQPRAGDSGDEPRVEEHDGEQRACAHGRGKAEREAPPRP